MSSITIFVNGDPLEAHEGDTVAAALLRGGDRVLHHTGNGAPRGLFCGIGSCYDCYTTIDGVPYQRSCLAHVQTGMRVETHV